MENLVLQRFEGTNELRFRGFYDEQGRPTDINTSPALVWYFKTGRVEVKKHYRSGLLHDAARGEPAIVYYDGRGRETERQHFMNGERVAAPHIANLFGQIIALYPGHGYVAAPQLSPLTLSTPNK